MTKHNKLSNPYRALIMAGTAVGTLLQTQTAGYPFYALLVLLMIINMQLRIELNQYKVILLSVIVDIPLILYTNHRFPGYIYFMLLVTLIDILLRLKAEAYPMLSVVTATYGYCIISAGGFKLIFILSLLYILVLMLLIHLRLELLAKTDIELLYDRLRQNNHDLEAARARLLDYSRQVERVTALEERNRISRELHDSIGHSLTGILMQVDAAAQIMERDSKKGMELLHQAYGNINISIETVRQTVRKMRPVEYRTHTSSLEELIEKFKNTTGASIQYNTNGIPYELFPSVETVLYQNIQEALTNAVRHSQAKHISIQMTYRSDGTELLISDDGIGCREIKKGFGLSGMEERLEVIGGKIKYNGERGFSIYMYLPRKEI